MISKELLFLIRVRALTLYFYIQCSHITLAVFILDGKLIRFTVAPAYCKESDGRVCFCYIRCHSSNVR